MRTKSADSVLQVSDVHVTIKDKEILKNVRAEAKSGDLLAILGPTGCGKTTLLNVIAGRLKHKSGAITLNGEPYTKRLRRRLAFVQQQDVFFSQLTLWETLYFTAQIRLPDSYTEAQKRERVDEIIDTLDMKKCANTIIGDVFVRGLSGGEKKRASIACELLTDPDILLMDEPTSGLDSSTAQSIMVLMKSYANDYNKTIITTIHQPSSQIYHLFNNILLLVEGQEAYFGPARSALDHFCSIGLPCETNFNPADFLLQVVKADEETVSKIVREAAKKRYGGVTASHTSLNHVSNGLMSNGAESNHIIKHSDVKVLINGDKEENEVQLSLIRNKESMQDDNDSEIFSYSETSPDDLDIDSSVRDRWVTSWLTQYKMLSWRTFKQTKDTMQDDNESEIFSYSETSPDDLDIDSSVRDRWVTSWLTQYKMLSWRTFKQTKGVLKQGYMIIQTTIISLVIGLIYWQINFGLSTVRDIQGLIFFAISYWSFNPAFEQITTFLAEKAVVAKERASGSYRLSAYYLAKVTSDLALVLILPTFQYLFLYLVSGIGNVANFFATWPIVMLQVPLAQATGLLIVTVFPELKPALTCMVSYMLSSFMIGGFFTQSIPFWLEWGKYFSIMLYSFGALNIILFKDMPPTSCNDTSALEYPQCTTNSTAFVYPDDILQNAGLDLEIPCYVGMMVIITFIIRVIGYYVLRFKRQVLL